MEHIQKEEHKEEERQPYAVKPLTMWAYRTRIRSSQPQRRCRSVVTPNSLPLDCNKLPTSWTTTNTTTAVRSGIHCKKLNANMKYWNRRYVYATTNSYCKTFILHTTLIPHNKFCPLTLSCSVGKAPTPTRVV